MAESPEQLLGHFGGRFRLREAYSGGEGQTLRIGATTLAGECDRVLKVLSPGAEPQEAALLLALQHPAIPAIREVGRLPEGRAFVVRDHVDGEALRTLPADPAELLALLQELLEVLAYVHLRGVVHLDLKPSNLLRDRHGRLHLLDFGLGARRGEQARGGTPFFAAPELLLGAVPDARADLFSVGAMVAQALLPSGKVPLHRFVGMFPGEDFFTALGTAAAEFPAPFDQFLARCVAQRPARRFQDAQAALEFLCGGSGRPQPSLLAPDPVVLFGPELAAATTATLAHATTDLLLCGGPAEDRRALALHLVATTRGARELREGRDELRVVRGGGGGHRIDLPRLTPERLLGHLEHALGLVGPAAIAAARWLVARGGDSGVAVHEVLLDLVQAGDVVPSGSRWSWPAAFSGRLLAGGANAERPAPTAANVRRTAARGQRELAVRLWREGSAADPARERGLREALAEGLLDAGEPAQAIAFCADLPLLHAQALLDLGQIAAAGRTLAGLDGSEDPARRRRVQAMHLLARGERSAAVNLLRHPEAGVGEQLMLATALEMNGELEPAEALLQRLLAALPAAEQPFARASASTELGHVARRRGDLPAAQAHFGAAAELLFGIGHVRHAAKAQQNLGVIAKDRGDHEEAVARLREARTLYQHAGDLAGVAVVEANLGIAALARGDASAARPWLLQATPVLLRLGNLAAGRLAQVMLARAHAGLGDRDAAIATLQELGAPDTDRLREEVARVHAVLAATAPAAAATAALPIDDDSMPPNQGPSRELFRTFLAVNRQLAQENDLDKAMRHLLDAAVTLSGGRQGYLLVAREGGMQREFQSGDPGPSGQAFSRSLAHRAMHLQRTLTGADALADRELQEMPSIRNLQVRSAICAPFRSAGGTVGAIYVEHPGRAGAFLETDKEALEVLADQAAIAVDRMLREEALAAELQQSKRDLAVAKRSVRRETTVLLGDSAPMRDLRAQIEKLAPLELPVLILGETGSGKELVARALHEQGHRLRGPFVAENCSALPAELMERELFGHVQGAFTGADRDRPGLLELASGGTLFLDEVGDMPPALQAKLLRALQEQAIRRVGGSATIRLDLRLLAATHKDLRAMVQRGEFREDLFFRLAAVELRVPPLRERGGDVVLLAETFLQRHGEQHGRQLRLGAVAKAALPMYPWPGNVRELDHVIARVALLSTNDEIQDLQLPVLPMAAAGAGAAPTATAGAGSAEVVTLKEAERRAILTAMQANGGDKAKTARALEVSRTALYEKLKRHGLS